MGKLFHTPARKVPNPPTGALSSKFLPGLPGNYSKYASEPDG